MKRSFSSKIFRSKFSWLILTIAISTGFLTTSLNGATFVPDPNDTVKSVLVQPDGRVLVGGWYTSISGQSQAYLSRLLINGYANLSFTPSISDRVWCVALQPDKKILIGGQFSTVNGVARPAIARLNPDGTLDTTFNAVIQQIPQVEGVVFGMALQPDGKIVIVGVFSTVSGQPRNNIARLNPDGSLDTTFNAGAATPISSNEVYVVVRQSDGKLLIGGYFTMINGVARSHIARLNADGSLDTSFDPGFPHWVYAIAVQPDGKIIAVGENSPLDTKGYMTRLNNDGSVDGTFAGGIVESGEVSSVALQSDGKILVGGRFTSIGGQPRSRIARLNPNGTADSFNPSADGEVWAIAVQPDGKVVIGGDFHNVWGQPRYHIARVRTDGRLDLGTSAYDFDGDVNADLSIFRPSVGEWWIHSSYNGGTMAGRFGSSEDIITPADFTGDGAADAAFFRPSTGFWYVFRGQDSTFYAFPFGANGDVPIPADYDGDGFADAAVFRPSTATWYVSKTSGGTMIEQFGLPTDKPVPADYDGDGRADMGVFRPNGAYGAEWWISTTSRGVFATQFGESTD